MKQSSIHRPPQNINQVNVALILMRKCHLRPRHRKAQPSTSWLGAFSFYSFSSIKLMIYLTKQQINNLEEKAVNFFGLEKLQLTESAGRSVAELLREKMGNVQKRNILVLAGKGYNGCDAIVAARYLQNFGAECTVIMPVNSPEDLVKEAKWNFGILKSMYVNHMFLIHQMGFRNMFKQAEFVIDGLLGYNTNSDPKGVYADLINMSNELNKKVLSIDIPSGLDADTGNPYNPTIKAKWTLSLTLPKKGCLNKEFTGELYVADIGIPHDVYTLLELDVKKLFEKKSIIKI